MKELREIIWSICQDIRLGILTEGEASIKIIAEIKQANYVRLSPDQSLPEAVLSTLGLKTVNATVKILQREGWRRVE